VTPNDYTREIVLPTMAEFVNDPMNVRRMYLACVTTYHLVDYLNPRDPKSVEQQVMKQCGLDMQIVYEVCVGAKHAVPRKAGQFKAGDEVKYDPGFPYRFPIFFGGCLCVAHNGRYESVYHCIHGVLSGFKHEFPQELLDLDLSFMN
jgi:hypothetical protein